MAFSFGAIAGNTFQALARGTTSFFIGLAVLIVACIIGYFIWRWYQNLAFYKTPVSLTVLMENGSEKTQDNLKGAVFWNNGIRDFKVKIPGVRKPHILGFIPDFGRSSSIDGRIKFITSGDRTSWQQYETKWVLKETGTNADGTMFEYDLVSKPVPSDTKKTAVNAIKSWRDTVDKSRLTAFGIAIGGLIILVIAHLVSLFIQTKIRCPLP